jgi:hypothetical protein
MSLNAPQAAQLNFVLLADFGVIERRFLDFLSDRIGHGVHIYRVGAVARGKRGVQREAVLLDVGRLRLREKRMCVRSYRAIGANPRP